MIHRDCSGCAFKHSGTPQSMDDLERCLECFNTDYEKPETLEDELRPEYQRSDFGKGTRGKYKGKA